MRLMPGTAIMDKTEPINFDWPTLESSSEWQTIMLPFLLHEQEAILGVLTDRKLCSAPDDLAYLQGRLAATRLLIEAPEYYMSLRRLAARADEPQNEEVTRLYGRRDDRLTTRR